MTRLTYKALKEYMENLADQHHAINNFVGYSPVELQSAVKSIKAGKYPMLDLFQYEGKLKGNHQRTLSIKTIGFAILFGGNAVTNYAGQTKAISKAEQYGMELLARINYDSKTLPMFHWLYNNFKKNEVEFDVVRQTNQAALYGMQFFFDLTVPEPLVVNKDHWADISKTC